jgi:hypothetical protein
MENIPIDKNEDLGKDYKCIQQLKEYRGYIPASIGTRILEAKLLECKHCALQKYLGFCVIKDELEEIKSRAIESQKSLKSVSGWHEHPSYSRIGQAIVKRDYEGRLGGGTPKNALKVPGIVHN